MIITAAAVLAALLAVLAGVTRSVSDAACYWPLLLAGWFALGVAYSCAVTPGGRLLRRSADASDRPAVFAAQFALSHVCWLVAYPLAGWLGAGAGMAVAFAATSALALAGVAIAVSVWPAGDPEVVAHRHDDLPPGHPHLRQTGAVHEHAFVIDEFHNQWPK